MIVVVLNEPGSLDNAPGCIFESGQEFRNRIPCLVQPDDTLAAVVHYEDVILVDNETTELLIRSLVEHGPVVAVQVSGLHGHIGSHAVVDPEHAIGELVNVQGNRLLHLGLDQDGSLVRFGGVDSVHIQRRPFNCRDLVIVRCPVQEPPAHVHRDGLWNLLVKVQPDDGFCVRLLHVQLVDPPKVFIDPVQATVDGIKGQATDVLFLVQLIHNSVQCHVVGGCVGIATQGVDTAVVGGPNDSEVDAVIDLIIDERSYLSKLLGSLAHLMPGGIVEDDAVAEADGVLWN